MAFWKKKKQDQTAPPVTAPNSSTSNLNEIVLQSIHEGVAFIGQDGNVRLANPSAVRLLGRGLDEILGLNYDSVFDFFDKTGQRVESDRNPIAIALRTGKYAEARDLELLARDSRKATPISILLSPTPPVDGQSSLVVTFRDIAKELEEEKARSEFISTASHEMRTPVASIEGYLGLALNPSTASIDERARAYLDKAHESSQHLGRLFQDLLDSTKLDDGQIQPKPKAVEVVSLVKSIADEQAGAIAQKGLSYQFGSGSDESQLTGGRHISQVIYASLDVDFMREILNNLIENAIKYTPAGAVGVNVSADDMNVRITVSDTGIGIPREETEHIFQKFYRVDNRDTREIGGTGLGLYLVKERTEAMNGRVWVESTVGQGSKFILLFPRMSEKDYQQRHFAEQNTAMQNAGL